MKNRTSFKYFWKEGVQNIFLHGFMSFAAVSIILAMLLITGSVALISYNIDLQIIKLQQESEVVIFVGEDLDAAQTKDIGDKLRAIGNVREATFQSREQALEEYRKKLGSNAELLDGFDRTNNPLRDAYHITLKDVTLVQSTIEEIKSVQGVANVRVNEDTIAMLVKVQHVFQIISVALVVALGLISIFIISNTVKLAMFTRRNEIAIQKMVGATNWFIRWPFVIEGMLLGLAAGALAFLTEWGVYAKLSDVVSGVLPSFSMAPFAEIRMLVLGVYLAAGVIVGVGGSVLTIRRFMDV